MSLETKPSSPPSDIYVKVTYPPNPNSGKPSEPKILGYFNSVAEARAAAQHHYERLMDPMMPDFETQPPPLSWYFTFPNLYRAISPHLTIEIYVPDSNSKRT